MASSQPKKGCTCCRLLLIAAVLGAAGVGLGVYFGVIDADDLDDLVDAGQDLIDAGQDFVDQILNTDPFVGVNGTEYMWQGNNGRGGLGLEIQNALTDDWHTYFNQAISDWDSGTPDALTLSTSIVTADSECTSVDGVMKVCNGDYGDTGWRGINLLALQTVLNQERIIASTAKMNEYYVKPSDTEERQYTMCHEIGHGFGLPHTDENFYNQAQGDCLDYTEVDKDKNLKPGQVNYDKLAGLYGVVGTTRRLRTSHSTINGTVDTPERVLDVLGRKRKHLESHLKLAHQAGWVLVHRGMAREHYTVDLGGGYSALASVLLTQ